MKNIQKTASEIIKEAKDNATINRMKMLWAQYKDNIGEFSKKLGETFKKNMLSFSVDKNWILKALSDITGEEWHVSGHDFKIASTRKR